MSEKKILFVIPALEGGGAERAASNLLNKFAEEDFETVLVVFSRKLGYGVPDKIKVISLNISDSKNFIYTIIKFFLVILRLSRIQKQERPASILSFLDYTNNVVLLSTMFQKNKPKVVLSVRSSPSKYLKEYSATTYNLFISIMMKLLYNRADSIIAVSDHVKNDLAENYRIDPWKITTIYNPVDIGRIMQLATEPVTHPWFNEKIPIVLSVGRLSEEKGLSYLLKAFAHVLRTYDCRLVVVGDGPEEANLKKLAQEIGILESVDFAGFQKNTYKYMKHSTIFVLSSLFEGFPNVLVEAMACGLPVIATRYDPGYNAIIENEKNGLLVPVADEKALTEALLRLLENPEERRIYSDNAIERVKQFSIKQIAEEYKNALMDIKNE